MNTHDFCRMLLSNARRDAKAYNVSIPSNLVALQQTRNQFFVQGKNDKGTTVSGCCKFSARANYITKLVYDANPQLTEESPRIRCNQCEALMINGLFCHETGCPNTNSRYDINSGEWIKQRKCFECGYMCDVDSECCSKDED